MSVNVLTVIAASLPSLQQLRWEEISITQPEWLWLLLLLPVLLWVQRYSLVDLSRFQQFLSFVFRALVIVCLAFAMAGVATRSFSQKLTVVVAVDVSPSVPDQGIKQAQAYLETLWKARKGEDNIRVLSFASSTRLLDVKNGKAPELKRHPQEQSSDLQNAIRHAYGLFPEGSLRRIVVISDGRETEGSAIEEVARAKKRGIKVFSSPIKGPYPAEMLIQNIVVPDIIRIGSPFKLRVEVFSSYEAAKVPLTIYKNGFLFAFRRLKVKRGLNVEEFRVKLDEPGMTSFQAILKPPRDRFRGNNYFVRAIPIKGPPRVLYLEGEPSRAHYLARALRKRKFKVDVRSSYGVPTKLRDLERYDMVLLSDIAAYRISARQMRLLESYVKDLGGGFAMVGGKRSFGPGGYFQTRIEKMLPVRFDLEKKKEMPSLAMVMVIDKSGSMGGTRIRLAREAAKITVRLLGPTDQVGVVAFDSTPREIVSLQSASNKSRILYDISRIPATGGTSIAPALERAYNMLRGARAKVKHVILLSDGQDSNQRAILDLAQTMRSENITVSSVAVGSGSDRRLLRSIAELGGGRSYYTEDPYNIPKIFTKETKKVGRSSFVEEPFRPRVLHYTKAIKGVNFGNAPSLLGYVSTKAKPRTTVVLGTENGEPLLVSWRYGLGKVAAFTSDVKNRWAVQWLSWSGFGQFWAQLVRDTMRQGPSKDFQVRASIDEGVGRVRVDAIDGDGKFLNYLKAKVTIIDPKLKRKTVYLRQTGPGYYEGRFTATRHGAYLVKARFFQGKRLLGIGEASASYSYPAEWLSASPDQKRLRSLAKAGGGRFAPKPKVLWKRKKEERLLSHRPLWPYLVMLALFMFLFDLLLRRVRIFGRATMLSNTTGS